MRRELPRAVKFSRFDKVNMQKPHPLTSRIILSNLAEANEEIAKLIFRTVHGGLREEHLQIGLLHAYHHLNFAWNVRRTPTAKYVALSKKQFEKWGRYPADIEL